VAPALRELKIDQVNRLRWRVAGVSVCGASHERLGLPCQDAHQWTSLSDELILAAVADGAGSALLAEVGATLAVAAAISSARERFAESSAAGAVQHLRWEALLTHTLSAARAALEREAEVRSLPLRDFACTLTVVVAGRDFVAAMQVGDGAVVVAEPDGVFLSILRPVQGECLNETVFLTSPESVETSQPNVWHGRPAHLAVLSDGLQMMALRMPSADPHPGFFTPLFQFLSREGDGALAREALSSFLTSPRTRERTDDDVTLLLATLVE
jgi:hypothetical protein